MDPNASIQEILYLLADGRLDEAADRAEDLEMWVTNGGFSPDAVDPMRFVRAVRQADKKPAASTLQARIDGLRAELNRLVNEQAECHHRWGAPVFDPLTTGGYDADVPNAPGPGFRMYIEPTTTRRWRRTCTLCGCVQHTERTCSTGEKPTFG